MITNQPKNRIIEPELREARELKRARDWTKVFDAIEGKRVNG